MKILFLASGIPSTHAHSGFVVVYQRMRLLAERGHKVGLAAFAGDGEAAEVESIKPFFGEVEYMKMPPAPLSKRLLGLLPFPVPRDFNIMRCEEMRRLVGRMIERSRYDVVIAEFAQMGQYLFRNPYLPAVRRVVSCHACYTTAARRSLDVETSRWMKLRTLWRMRGLEQYEFDMYRNADHVVTLSPEEKVELHHYAPDLRISISPYGVDTAHFRPNPQVRKEKIVVFTGYFGHVANQDAVNWFAREIWPSLAARHADLRFMVVGREPSREMKELASRDSRIVVTGEVPDMAEHLWKAACYVCPVRMGKGLRGKILQAMSAGVPVVSTSAGAEGISARNGYDIFLADTPHAMMENISLLLGDHVLRRFVGRNARRLAVSRYSWPHCVDLLEDVLNTVVT